ncbi:MAG: hypothetical protein ACYC06_12005, partial [Ilumatobacteraceae bacterium]
VKNVGRAMITKKAKTQAIDDGTWQRMLTEWNRNFPTKERPTNEREVTGEVTTSIVDLSGRSFSVGDKVEHASFGKGIIIRVVEDPYVDGKARHNEAEILFENENTCHIAVSAGTFLKLIG